MSKKSRRKAAVAAPLTTLRPNIDTAVFLLGLLGVLVVVHLWIQSGRGFDRGCFGFAEPARVEAASECETVIGSDAGTLFGVSNVIWGGFFYLGLTGLSLALATSPKRRLGTLKRLRALAIAFGFAYSLYLSYVQIFEIGELCKLCLLSASVVALLFMLQVLDFATEPGTSGAQEASRSPRRSWVYIGCVAAAAIVATVDVAYFRSLPESDSARDEASARHPEAGADLVDRCGYDRKRPRVENYRDLVDFADPSMGNPDAPVLVIEFFDLNCPHCKALQPVMREVVAANGGAARFVLRPFVLGQQSFVQTEALLAAAQQNRYFEMLEAQLERQKRGGLSLDELRAIATEIGMDAEAMAGQIREGSFRQAILRQREAARAAGVTSVPAVMINGRWVSPFSRNAACLTQLIAEAAG
ncbi:MAG: thioredoxin domain-containing protein [Myxococcales bacterium]|nr:thioredoxin domain-containing protein [Myxococcales bacterium]